MTLWQFLLLLLGIGGGVWLTSTLIMRLWRDPERDERWPAGYLGEVSAGIDQYADISSYAYPPGQRDRYTEAGWNKWIQFVSDFDVHPGLQFHELGCVKRYGAQSDALCRCEESLKRN